MFTYPFWQAPTEQSVPAGRRGAEQRRALAERQERLLDEALMETFPASDPVSVMRLT